MNPLVECHSEFAYAERPVALTWEGRHLEVKTVVASWRKPGLICFRVVSEDGQIFELSYSELADEWQITQA